jgi:lysophospholipase L1-like esterase
MSRLRQLGGAIRYLWLMAGLTLLFLLAIEGFATVALNIHNRWKYPPGDTRLRADAYGNAPWVSDYYNAFHRGRDEMRWMSYVYWRRRPWQSPYINVDERGIRKTTSSAKDGTVTIFMFGGSTMWGSGARDEYTIPSVLARELERKGISATVVNYGETGWVSTQELIALELELRQGRRPDLVVFYDGINDTYTAFQQGVAGIPQNEFNRVTEFNFMQKSVKERLGIIGRDAADRLSTRKLFELFQSDVIKGIGVKLDEAAPGFNMDAPSVARLAGQVIDTYVSNVELVNLLGEHYHFKPLFYWQPSVAEKPQLTAYEKELLVDMQPTMRFFEQTNQTFRDRRLDQPGPGRVRDLLSTFSETSAPMFIDRFHLGEAGNEAIARLMLPDVLAQIDQLAAGKANGHAHVSR